MVVFHAACAGETAADAARGISTQLSSLEAQAAGQAEELRELQAMKQVGPARGTGGGGSSCAGGGAVFALCAATSSAVLCP
jgi:hypothetical protein